METIVFLATFQLLTQKVVQKMLDSKKKLGFPKIGDTVLL